LLVLEMIDSMGFTDWVFAMCLIKRALQSSD